MRDSLKKLFCVSCQIQDEMQHSKKVDKPAGDVNQPRSPSSTVMTDLGSVKSLSLALESKLQWAVTRLTAEQDVKKSQDLSALIYSLLENLEKIQGLSR